MSTKLKLLYLMQFLIEYTDENHTLNASELVERLTDKGITAERKSIYRDIELLRSFGIDIEKNGHGYYVATRDFQLPEVRLLRDAVLAASFITPRKTTELLDKLRTLTSKPQAQTLDKQVGMSNPSKSLNEQIYYTIDTIQSAIDTTNRIRFSYNRDTLNDAQNKVHEISPYALVWNNEKYYLIGNNDKFNDLMHFRLDRIKNISLLHTKSRPFEQVCEYRGTFDTSDYCRRHLNMFSGDPIPVTFRCSNSVYPHFVDTFGRNLNYEQNGDKFTVTVDVAPTKGLLGYLAQFSGEIEILSPASVRKQMRNHLLEMAKIYRR